MNRINHISGNKIHFTEFRVWFCSLVMTLALPSISLGQEVESFSWGDKNAFHIKGTRSIKDTTKLDGPFFMYWQDVEVANGQFNNGLKTGTWKYTNIHTGMVSEGAYENGLQNGQWKYFYRDGSIQAIKQYKDGILNGLQDSFYSDGVPYSHLDVNKGIPNLWLALYNNGKDTAVYRSFKLKGHNLEMRHRSYYFNGPPQERFSASLESINKLEFQDHQLTTWDLCFLHPYRDSKNITDYYNISGTYKKFHPTGPLWEHHIYDNNKLINVIPSFDKWGNVANHGTYEDGSGTLIRYHHNGDTAIIAGYQDGLQHGQWYSYDERMRIRQKGQMISGAPKGNWVNYSNDLKVESTMDFKDNNQVITSIHALKDRKFGEMSHFQNIPHGRWFMLDQYEDTLWTADYENGWLQGTVKTFQNGILKTSGKASNGSRIGKWRTFNPRGKVTYVQDNAREVYLNKELSPPLFEVYKTTLDDFSYTWNEARIHEDFLESENIILEGQFYEITITLDDPTGDVVFMVDVEDTGHITGFTCMKHNGLKWYYTALSRMEKLLFAAPKQQFGFPMKGVFLISYTFDEI